MEVELSKKELRGLNLRLIIQISGFIITACSLYYGIKMELNSMREQTSVNKELLMDIKKNAQDNQRVNNDRMTVIEQASRQLDIRMTIIETEMKDKKQP